MSRLSRVPQSRVPDYGGGGYEAGQWKPLVSLVRTTHYATFIPVLRAVRNRNAPTQFGNDAGQPARNACM
jgi:hypothetical protein